MWVKKVFISAWFRGVVACLIPLLGLIMLIRFQINQIAENNTVFIWALSLCILNFVINLVFPFAVSWKRAILAVLPTFTFVFFFNFFWISLSGIYGGSAMDREFRELFPLFLGATTSIFFARLGAGAGILLGKTLKAR